ncbi:hypothetical protein RU639_013288 [Aspergillus parasiticus]
MAHPTKITQQFRGPISYSIAYGSDVFPQTTNKTSTNPQLHPNPPPAIKKAQEAHPKIIDFIFGISDAHTWHTINLQQHPHHYPTLLRSLGPHAISKCQGNFGAGVYFHPFITVNGTLIKYGVVNLESLRRDLVSWITRYLAGRMQKPVIVLQDNAAIRDAGRANLVSALRTALLLLPGRFTERELYATLAGLSYMGDPRMAVGGDDPEKVESIVGAQTGVFRELYGGFIGELENVSLNLDCVGGIEQDMDPVVRGDMVRLLPESFRTRLYRRYEAKLGVSPGRSDRIWGEMGECVRQSEDGLFQRRIAGDGGLGSEIRKTIEETVQWPSFAQSVKSAVTAGVSRSWRYAMEKRRKAALGRSRY